MINPGYNRSDLIPQIDKTKYLKIYCNIGDNKNDNEHLTNVFIKNGIGDLVVHDNFNIYKKQKIMDLILLIFILEIKIIKILN